MIRLHTFTHKQGREPSRRLVCLPHAGGNAHSFSGWPAQLPRDVLIQSVLLPGRAPVLHEAPLESVEEYVTELDHALGRGWPNLPLVLFGHSLGALIAYELAWRRWSTGGPLPAYLVVSGHDGPANLKQRGHVGHLPDREFLSAVRKLNGIPAAVLDEPELMNIVLPALRADFVMSEAFRPSRRPAIPVPLLALTGNRDPEVSPADASMWQYATSCAFRLRVLPGDHFFLVEAEQQVIEEVGALLSSLRSGNTRGGERKGW